MTPADSGSWRYAPGSGLLLGTGDRWLLLADQPDEGVILDLWDALLSVGLEQALAVLERAYVGRVPAVAGWDAGQSAVRGDGAVGDHEELTVGLPVEGPWLPLVGGIVAGAAARRESATPSAGRRRLIDGIPADIAAAVGPDVPARYDATPAERLSGADTAPPDTSTSPETTGAPTDHPDLGAGGTRRRPSDHDGRTTVRASSAGEADGDPFRQPTHETVLAVFCAHGHPTPAYSADCRVCHGEIPPQDPQRIPRPRLGGLRLPDGEVVALDRGVVIGRRPAPVDDQGEWPHLVTVPPESSYVSRVHVHVQIDGWLVVVRDLGSRGGTTLHVPGRAAETIRAQEPHVLEPGHALVLAEEYEVVYDVTPERAS